MPAPAAYCPDPASIPAVPEVTRLAPEKTEGERKRDKEEARAKSRAEEDAWKAGIPTITDEVGRARFEMAYHGGVDAQGKRVNGADPQQRVFIDTCADADQHGYRVIQGVACAGSGKSFSVVLGVAKAYYAHKIPPSQIIVTTFTNKASRELQERLCYFIPKSIVFSDSGLRVGTFHSGPVSGRALKNAKVAFTRDEVRVTDLTDILRDVLGFSKGQWQIGKESSVGLRTVPGYLSGPENGYYSIHWQGRVLPQEWTHKDLGKAAKILQEKADSDQVYFLKKEGDTLYEIIEPFVRNIWGVRARDIGDKIGGLSVGARAYNALISNKFEPWGMHSPGQVREYLGSIGNPDELSRGEKERYDHILEAKELASDEDTYPDFPGVWTDALRVKKGIQEYTQNDVLARYLEVAHLDRAKLIVVDEQQDNSWEQAQIVEKVARASNGTLMMVGDGRQSIFSFRGADPTIFQFAQEDYGAIRSEIGTNYRSGYWIIEAGNETCRDPATLTAYDWAIGEPAVTGRRMADGTPVQGVIAVQHYNPATKTVTGAVESLEHFETEQEYADRHKRGGKKPKQKSVKIAGEIPAAREVATRIAVAIQAGRKPSDFAILTKTNAALGAFELALSRFRVPVAYAGQKINFMSRPVITRMLRLLALCAPGVIEDPEMAARMILSVFRDDGSRWYGRRFERIRNQDFLDTVQRHWSRGILKVLDELGKLTPDRRSGVGKWRRGAEDAASDLAPLVENEGWPEAASLAADILTRWELLQTREEGEEVEIEPDDDEKDSFYQSLADIGATFATYKDFMEYVLKARSTQAKSEDDKVEGGTLVLSTAHKSKGLQWPVVYVIANAGIWPHKRSLANPKDLAGERRLYYVAITRAADECHVWSTGEGSSPFTIEVFQERIFPRMEKAHIEAERAKRLAEVDLREVDGGWAVFRNGVRLNLGGVTLFTTYEAAAEAYLAPHEESEVDEAPFAGQIQRFLDWLTGRAPDVARHLRAHPGYARLLESLFADTAVSRTLGWSLLADLFPMHPSNVEILTPTGKRIGYLIRARGAAPAVFHGYLEIRAPFADYTVRPIPADDVPETYGTRFEDYSPSLLEARYAYATLLPEDRVGLGEGVPFDAPKLLDMPLIDFGPVSVGPTGVESGPPAPVEQTPLEVTLPSPADQSSPHSPESSEPRSTPRRLLPLAIPGPGWALVVASTAGIVIKSLSLDQYTEYPVLERAVLRHTGEDGIVTIYRAMAGSVDKHGRVTAGLQQVAGGTPDFQLAKFDLRPLAGDLLDSGLRAFLGSPGIIQYDQLLWEAAIGCPLLVDLQGILGGLVARGASLTTFGKSDLKKTLERLTGSGWFQAVAIETGTELHWQMEKIQRLYGEAAWPG